SEIEKMALIKTASTYIRIPYELNSGSGFPFAVTEFTFPSGNNRGCKAIADKVNGCPGHIHQFIHSDNQQNSFQRQIKGNQGTGQNDLRCAGYSCHTFASKHQREHDKKLLREGKVHSGSLGHEYGSNTQM